MLKWDISAVQRSDSVSSNSKRKISSISASDTSDHEATETEAAPGEHIERHSVGLIPILVPSLEVPEAVEETYRPEETIEDDPNLEVIISYEGLMTKRFDFVTG